MINLEMNQLVYNYITSLPENNKTEFEFRMSNAGQCPRLMDYQLRDGRAKPRFEQAMRMARGTSLHHMWRAMMMEMFGENFQGSEKEITMTTIDGLTVPGHCDGYIKDFDALWELKNVSTYTYQKVVNEGYPIESHFLQANAYAFYYPCANVLMHYFNCDTCESYFMLIPLRPKDALISTENMRQAFVNNGETIRPRPYNDPTGSPCWFCEKNEECYKDWAGEVKTMKVEMIADEKFELMCSEAESARRSRLDSDKQEEKLKGSIADYMLGRKIKEAKSGQYNVNVTLGKKGNPLVKIKQTK